LITRSTLVFFVIPAYTQGRSNENAFFLEINAMLFLAIRGRMARCLATTNVIESSNSVVRRVSKRVTNYRDVNMVMRWAPAGFLEA